jgi:hypothetical protein
VLLTGTAVRFHMRRNAAVHLGEGFELPARIGEYRGRIPGGDALESLLQAHDAFIEDVSTVGTWPCRLWSAGWRCSSFKYRGARAQCDTRYDTLAQCQCSVCVCGVLFSDSVLERGGGDRTGTPDGDATVCVYT